jgi:hypothetical protein
MNLYNLTQELGDKLRLAFPEYLAVEEYVGQFNPEDDTKVVHATPSLFYGITNGVKTEETLATYDLSLSIACVIVLSDLDKFERNKKGWNDAEILCEATHGISGYNNQANVPVVTTLTKVDRPTELTNAGYSYWILTFTIDWRLNGVLPRR